jgi:hypothetical protein
MRLELKTSILGCSIVMAAMLSSACVDHVGTAINPCPCASDAVCCESGVCASDSTSCGAATAALSESVEGAWTGYIEGFFIPEDAIRIAVQAANDGTLSGQVTFGDGPPPPPATNPNVGWPPGAPLEGKAFISGYAYAARDINWQARRLKLRVLVDEPYEPYCALQMPYLWPIAGDPPFYQCFSQDVWNDGYGHCYAGPMPDATQEIDCGYVYHCGAWCSCDATHCATGTQMRGAQDGYYSADIAFDGANATGSFFIAGANYNLRLTRAGSVPAN